MNYANLSGIDPEEIKTNMIKALSINQSIKYVLEREELMREIKFLEEQSLCCLRTYAAVVNSIEISEYEKNNTEPEFFNISNFTKDAVSSVENRLRNLTISVQGEIEKGIVAYVNPDRYASCLMNLIVNACSNVDSDEGEIIVKLEQKLGYAVLTVLDNGYGMSQSEFEERIKQSGAHGLEVLGRFCKLCKTQPLNCTNENSGFGVIVKIPLRPDEGENPPSDFKTNSAVFNSSGVSPYVSLIYKIDGASVII